MLSPVLWLKKWHCSSVGQDFIPSGIKPLERGWGVGGGGGVFSVWNDDKLFSPSDRYVQMFVAISVPLMGVQRWSTDHTLCML